MLPNRALLKRGNLHVCLVCRQELRSWRSELRHDIARSSITQFRSTFSTTRTVLQDSDNGKPSNGVPNVFPGGFAAGSFGSFANKPAETLEGNIKRSDLLPHERDAIASRKATEPPRPIRKENSGADKESSRNRGKNQRKRPSASIADMLQRNKTPQVAVETQPQRPGQGEINFQSSAELKSRGIGHLRVSKKDDEKRATKSPEKWGSFSKRVVQTNTTPDVKVKTGTNSSTAWLQMENKRHTRPKAQSDPASSDDFWAELEKRADEKRATRFERGPSRQRPNQGYAEEPLQKGARPKDSAQEYDANPPHRSPAREAATPATRSSRFEPEYTQNRDVRSKTGRDKKSRRDSRISRGFVEEEEQEADDRSQRKKKKQADREEARMEQAGGQRNAIPILLPEYITTSSLANSLRQSQEQFLRDMVDMGFENVTGDTLMTGETGALIAMEYGFEPTVDDGAKRDLRPRPLPEDPTLLPQRPPVVTIMGHVDHGKTTLLDYLRKSSIAAQEHGGITQHIGAFVVEMSQGKRITFLDTPGHAAFLSMRQRGAIVTDIVILVVAADDSVMPQTIEAIKHAKAAKVPIIVAINKIDKEDARIQQVKSDLMRYGVEIEDYGGDVQVVLVSGKTGKGMDDLEENIVTLSEILDVRAEPDGMAEGWVLESSIKIDGKVATVLVKRGTLRTGDIIVAGRSMARVRILRNEAGVEISEAPPGTPVEVLGWRDLPEAGQQILQAPNEDAARTAVEYRTEMAERQESGKQIAEQERKQREKAAEALAAREAEEAGELGEREETPGVIYQNFVVKADVAGSVEAVCGSLLELGNHEVQSRVLRSSAGQISEYDVDHAAASNSIIVNFNSAINPQIKQRADSAQVRIMDYNVIYHLVDDAKSALSDLLPSSFTHRVLGEADILQVFPINIRGKKYKNIAGCRVRNGNIKRTSKVKVLRKGKVVFDGNIDTLKHVKKDVQETGKGTECGVGFEKFEDFQVDDQIQCYEVQEEKRTL